MTLRAVQRSDADALLRLWNEAAHLDPLTPALLEEKVWADPDLTADLAPVIEEAGQVAGFAAAVVRDPGERATIKLFAVRPDRWRRGLGERLLGALEARMRERGVRTVRLGESAPNYLVPGLDPRYTRALLFFEKHGYRRFAETYNLAVDLHARQWDTAAEELTLAEAGVAIRRAVAADRPAVHDFLNEHWPAWRHEVDHCLARQPAALHLAISGPEVIGFAGYDGNNVGTGWFGPMGTAPAARGMGIGSVLLRRCLGDLREQGLQRAVIPWVGPVGFYAHHADAAIERVFYRYEKTLQRATGD